MSTQQKGSIVLKLLILLLAVALIVVILIPGDIWEKEDHDTLVCRGNLESIYEAERFYYKTYNEYTKDPLVLISAIQQDSSLDLRKKIVSHTQIIKTALDDYLSTPIIKRLTDISQNIVNTENDLENNERYFTRFPEILDEEQNIKMEISTLRSGVEHEDYRLASLSLDSLLELRRDLTDYSLQEIARRGKELSSSITLHLSNIDFVEMASSWGPINTKLSNLMNEVLSSELKNYTSVADRVADFQAAINNAFHVIADQKLASKLQAAQSASANIDSVYSNFLTDFLVTEHTAMYRIADTDSMMLALNPDNFKPPIGSDPYHFIFTDTLGLTVECPLQAKKLESQGTQIVEAINRLPILPAFDGYKAQLDSAKKNYYAIKAKYRRNTEVFIKTKELDKMIDDLTQATAWSSYLDLKAFVENVPENYSYSDIKAHLDNALLAVGSFKQIYTDQIFGKLDSSNVQILNLLSELNGLISNIRRNTMSTEQDSINISTALSQIKAINGSGTAAELANIKADMEQMFLNASEGDSKTVYGIFSTKIKNHGKVYGITARKSWEE